MRRRITTAAFATGMGLVGLATPASAALQVFIDVTVNGVSKTLTCSESAACNIGATPGELQLADATLNGVKIQGELDTASGVPGSAGIDFLNSSVGTVKNNSTKYVATIDVVVSDTSFAAPVTSASLSGAGTFQSSNGSSITMNWFDDKTNTQGANNVGNTPGTNIGSVTQHVTGVTDGISINASSAVSNLAPFSLTEQSIYTLKAGGELLNRGQTVVLTVPEVSTWAMMLLGFASLGFAGYRRNTAAAYPGI